MSFNEICEIMLQIVTKRVSRLRTIPSCGLMNSETDYWIYYVTDPIGIHQGNAIFLIYRRFVDIINKQ